MYTRTYQLHLRHKGGCTRLSKVLPIISMHEQYQQMLLQTRQQYNDILHSVEFDKKQLSNIILLSIISVANHVSIEANLLVQ